MGQVLIIIKKLLKIMEQKNRKDPNGLNLRKNYLQFRRGAEAGIWREFGRQRLAGIWKAAFGGRVAGSEGFRWAAGVRWRAGW